MGNALFIVWRESVEAMLVIGVLYAWLKRNEQAGVGVRALWLGGLAGLALAALLGWCMVTLQGQLSGDALEWFQIAILFTAAALIAQMVLWMQRHGRHMRQRLERDMARAAQRSGGFGIAAVVALAVAREGAETVIFLYGMGMEQGDGRALTLGAGLGLVLAAATAWAVNRGLRALSYHRFFRISGLVLLMFALALLAGGVDRVIGLGWLPALIDPLWDSSPLIDDGSPGGALFAAFTGYRARPSLTLVMVYCAYWSAVLLIQRKLARDA